MDNGAHLVDEKSTKKRLDCTETTANICGQEVTVDTHDYVLDEVVTGCTVEILKCSKCGEYSIGWRRGANEGL